MPISANFKGEFSEFYAAVEKATGKLVDFGEGATKVGTQLNRMVDNFSGRKLIQDATLMVKAIEEVGGVSKLTSAELATAGEKAKQAADKMRALGMEVPKGLQEVADAGQKSAFSLDALAKSAAGLAAGYLTIQAALAVVSKAWDLFIGFMQDSITAASDAEASQSRLIAALRAQNTAMPSVIALYDDYAASLQRTTVFEDDAAQAAMALLVTVGNVMPRDMEKALQASADLAEVMKTDLEPAAMLVAKAAGGHTAALAKLNIETKDASGKTKDFEGILTAIADKFGGQAAAAANTYAGRIKQLKNAWDDVQESVGRVITTNATFLEAVKVLTGAVAENTGELNQNQAVTNFVSDAVILAVKVFAVFVEAIARIGDAFADQLRDIERFTKALSWVVDATVKVTEVMAKLGSTAAIEALPGLLKVQGGLKGWTESMRTAIDRTEGFSAGAHALAEKAVDLSRQLEATRGKTVDVTRAQAEVPGVMNRSTEAIVDYAAARKKQEEIDKRIFEGMHKFAEMQEKTEKLLQQATLAVIDYVKAHRVAAEVISATIPADVSEQWTNWSARIAANAVTMQKWGDDYGDQLNRAAAEGKRFFDGWRAEIDKSAAFGERLMSGLLGALESGSGVGQTLGTMLGAELGTSLGKSVSKSLSGALGTKMGGMLGGMLGPLGAAAGEMLGGLTDKLFGKLFGTEKKETQKLRDAFVQTFGSLDEMTAKAEIAGYSLDKLLSVKKVEAFNAEVAKFQEALKFQDEAMNVAIETAKRYGFTLEELGPAMARQELDKQAQQLFKDWEVLNAAGIDTIAITTRMAESVNHYVNQAIAMGSEVPEAMRPMLQKMVDMGTLTDAQGNKIENLEDAGISFSMTMSQGFQALIGEVSRLTDAIARGLGLAIDTSSTKIRSMPRTVDVGVVYHDPGFDTRQREVEVVYKSGSSEPVESYQGGTDGFRNFGAGTMVMLHGWEAVVPREEGKSTGGGSLALLAGGAGAGGGGGEATVNNITINAGGAFFDTPGSLQQLANKVETALSARHGLKNKRRAA